MSSWQYGLVHSIQATFSVYHINPDRMYLFLTPSRTAVHCPGVSRVGRAHVLPACHPASGMFGAVQNHVSNGFLVLNNTQAGGYVLYPRNAWRVPSSFPSHMNDPGPRLNSPVNYFLLSEHTRCHRLSPHNGQMNPHTLLRTFQPTCNL